MRRAYAAHKAKKNTLKVRSSEKKSKKQSGIGSTPVSVTDSLCESSQLVVAVTTRSHHSCGRQCDRVLKNTEQISSTPCVAFECVRRLRIDRFSLQCHNSCLYITKPSFICTSSRIFHEFDELNQTRRVFVSHFFGANQL